MLDQSNYQRMIVDRRDNGVVVVTLNRPEKSNAIDTRMHHELMTFSKDFSDDPDLRVLVLVKRFVRAVISAQTRRLKCPR
jgi:enoyl-CoA hydratase